MTYTTIRTNGLTRNIVVRTELSRQRASMRAVRRSTSFNRLAQDVADETHLSRSKEYPNKGRRECARRLRQLAA